MCGGKRGLNAVYLPRNREAINNHSKSGRPKRGLKGKTNLSAIGKRRKDSIGASSTLNSQRDKESLRLAIITWQQVNTG